MSEPANPLRLGVVIVNYRTLGPVHECLDALTTAMAHSGAAAVTLRVAVVDNSATLDAAADPSDAGNEAAALQRLCAAPRPFTVDYRPATGNHGYAAGVNLGAATLIDGIDLLWVLNPDVAVSPDAITALARIWAAGTPGDLMATSLEGSGSAQDGANSWISLWTSRVLAHPSRLRAGSFGFPSGASVLATRCAWSALEGMDERYFLFYEDVDLAVRARRGGLTITALPDVLVRHRGGASTGTDAARAQRPHTTQFYASRASVLFFTRHYRRYAPVIVLARIALGLQLLLTGNRPAGIARLRGVIAALLPGASPRRIRPGPPERSTWGVAATHR